MYVRWKRHLLLSSGWPRRRDSWPDLPANSPHRKAPTAYSHSAVLVETKRQDGRPRQCIVAHLATIRDPSGDRYRSPLGARGHFWATVTVRLDSLGLDAAARSRIEAALAKRVRPLTADEQIELDRRLREALTRRDKRNA